MGALSNAEENSSFAAVISTSRDAFASDAVIASSRAASSCDWATTRSVMSCMKELKPLPSSWDQTPSSTGRSWPSRWRASTSTRLPTIADSAPTTWRSRPLRWAPRWDGGTTVSARLRPSTSAAVHPNSASAGALQAVIPPSRSTETKASSVAANTRERRASVRRTACSVSRRRRSARATRPAPARITSTSSEVIPRTVVRSRVSPAKATRYGTDAVTVHPVFVTGT